LIAHALLASVALAAPLALTASPARLALTPGARGTVLVLNPGRSTAVVDVTRAAFSLDARGRPRIGGAGKPWFTVRPRRLVLPAGGQASLVVKGLRRPGAGPGDHASVLLLTSGLAGPPAVRVRMRIGVVVAVRVPGRVRRSLALEPPRVVRRARMRVLRVTVENRGNVDEWIGRERLMVKLVRRGRVVGVLRAGGRRLLAHGKGIVELRVPTRVRGRVRALMTIAPAVRGAPGARRVVSIRV
jgi:hypothetical protein